MMKIALLVLGMALLQSCAGVRQAQTGMRRAFNNATQEQYAWGEVFCGQGTVCSEIEVLRVDFEDRDQGQVQVTLLNRTGLDLQVQIALEIYNEQGAVIDQSAFQNVGMPASQQKTWSMPGIYKKGAKIRVVLRKI